MAQRKSERTASASVEAGSFQTVALAWHGQWSRDKSPRHAATVKSRLEVDVFPALGGRPVDAIEAPELVAVVKAIERREALDVARRALQTCGQIFRYAIAHGHCRRNPAADIKPADVLTPSAAVNFARIGERDLPKLLNDITHYKGQVVTRLALQLMSLTFPRTAELIGGQWPEIDWERSRWVIPAERMKMKTPHIVPLSKQAVALLTALKVVTGHGDLMFPGDVDRTQPMSNNTILGALYRMGYKGDMTGHGFRGLAATILNENDFDDEHVDLQLAHMKRNKVSAAYNHARYLKQRTEMMQWWADYLDRQRAKGVPAQ